MDKWKVVQGTRLAIDIVLRDANGVAITTFDGSQTLAGTVWPGGNRDAVFAVAVTWVTPGDGLILASLTADETASIPAGPYELLVTLTDGMVDPVEAYSAFIDVEAAPLAIATPVTIPSQVGGATFYSTTPTYCKDEDIALRAPQDYFAIANTRLTKGFDGVFQAGSPWVLTSPTVDFSTMGIAAGSIVQLSKGSFGNGELFAVDSVGANSVWLRRPGQTYGIGLPPGLNNTGPITFDCRTFGSTIDAASYDAKKFFGVDENIPIKSSARLYDQRELQQFTVLTVLRRSYIAADKAKAEDFDLKLGLVTQELEDLRSRLLVHWGALAAGDPPNSVFSARLRR